MRIRLLLALVVVALTLAAAGCGFDSGDQTTLPTKGMQAPSGFPGAGSPTAPNVTTTPGSPEKQSKGKAGGGSSATCIGC